MKKITAMICVLCVLMSFFSVMSVNAYSSDRKLILGDADLDERVNVRDATIIQKHVAGIILLSGDSLETADVDESGKINVKDATLIQKFVAGYSINFPIGKPMDAEEEIPSEPSTPDEVTTPDEPAAETPDENYCPTDTDLSDPVTVEVLWKIEEGFLRLVNEERAKQGRAPLTHNKHLDDVAQIRSAEIIIKYSHTRPNGELFNSLMDTAKYSYTYAGENINMGSHMVGLFNPDLHRFVGSDEQIESASTILFEAFKASPGHYANMIDEHYIHNGIGISYTYDPECGIPYFYIAHIFGSDR